MSFLEGESSEIIHSTPQVPFTSGFNERWLTELHCGGYNNVFDEFFALNGRYPMGAEVGELHRKVEEKIEFFQFSFDTFPLINNL